MDKPDTSTRETSAARPYVGPPRLRSDDEQMAEALDLFIVRLLQRPAVRQALAGVIAESVRQGTLRFPA